MVGIFGFETPQAFSTKQGRTAPHHPTIEAIRTFHPIARQFFDDLLEPAEAPTIDRPVPDHLKQDLPYLIAIELPS